MLRPARCCTPAACATRRSSKSEGEGLLIEIGFSANLVSYIIAPRGLTACSWFPNRRP